MHRKEVDSLRSRLSSPGDSGGATEEDTGKHIADCKKKQRRDADEEHRESGHTHFLQTLSY